jgi:hypothetical protein
MEATGYSETSVLTRPTQRYNPEDGVLPVNRSVHQVCNEVMRTFMNNHEVFREVTTA